MYLSMTDLDSLSPLMDSGEERLAFHSPPDSTAMEPPASYTKDMAAYQSRVGWYQALNLSPFCFWILSRAEVSSSYVVGVDFTPAALATSLRQLPTRPPA